MKRVILILLIKFGCLPAQTFSVVCQPSNNQISCNTPSVYVSLNNGLSASPTFTCFNSTFTAIGSTVAINTAGNFTIRVNTSSGLTNISLTITANTSIPVSFISASLQVVSQTHPAQSFTIIAISPPSNFTHYIYAPCGSTFSSNYDTIVYPPGCIGTYTYCIKNNFNGCLNCKLIIITNNVNGIEKLDANKHSKIHSYIYPNPFVDRLYFNPDEFSRLQKVVLTEVSNISKIISFDYEEIIENSLNLNELKPGAYILSLYFSDKGPHHELIMKEN